jgi:cell division protein ZapB
MSSQLLEQLESKIDDTIETIEILRLQIEELEEKNIKLQDENNVLKDKHTAWEKTLNAMLSKLKNIESATQEVIQDNE